MKSMVNWFTIPCVDFERAVRFYSEVFGIEMPRDKDPAGNDMACFFASTEGIAGAVNSNPGLRPGAQGPLLYLNAEGQIESVLERVDPAGERL